MPPRRPTVCFDIDGVIATGGPEVYEVTPPRYDLCEPINTTIETMRELRAKGVALLLHTARWQSDYDVTLKWLQRHDVPFDELHMGKPSAHVYVDDRSYPVQYRPTPHQAARILTWLRFMEGDPK